MTDPRTEAARIGFWDEGLGAWADEPEDPVIGLGRLLGWYDDATGQFLTKRKDGPTHECD